LLSQRLFHIGITRSLTGSITQIEKCVQITKMHLQHKPQANVATIASPHINERLTSSVYPQ